MCHPEAEPNCDFHSPAWGGYLTFFLFFPLFCFLNTSEIMLMSFLESSQQWVFDYFQTLDWWHFEYFYFKDKLPVNRSRAWGLEIASGSFSWAPMESGCSCPCGERWRGVVCTSLSTDVVLSSILTFLTSVGESVPEPFFWSAIKWLGWFRKGFAWRAQTGNYPLDKWRHLAKWQRWDPWGHWMSPAFPGVSRFKITYPKGSG